MPRAHTHMEADDAAVGRSYYGYGHEEELEAFDAMGDQHTAEVDAVKAMKKLKDATQKSRSAARKLVKARVTEQVLNRHLYTAMRDLQAVDAMDVISRISPLITARHFRDHLTSVYMPYLQAARGVARRCATLDDDTFLFADEYEGLAPPSLILQLAAQGCGHCQRLKPVFLDAVRQAGLGPESVLVVDVGAEDTVDAALYAYLQQTLAMPSASTGVPLWDGSVPAFFSVSLKPSVFGTGVTVTADSILDHLTFSPFRVTQRHSASALASELRAAVGQISTLRDLARATDAMGTAMGLDKRDKRAMLARLEDGMGYPAGTVELEDGEAPTSEEMARTVQFLRKRAEQSSGGLAMDPLTASALKMAQHVQVGAYPDASALLGALGGSSVVVGNPLDTVSFRELLKVYN